MIAVSSKPQGYTRRGGEEKNETQHQHQPVVSWMHWKTCWEKATKHPNPYPVARAKYLMPHSPPKLTQWASNHVLGHSPPIRPDIAICGHSDESRLFLSQDTLWGLWQWVWVRVVRVRIEGRGQDHLGGKIWAWMHGWLNRCLGCLVLESVVWCCWMFINHVIQAIIAREKLSSMLIPLF